MRRRTRRSGPTTRRAAGRASAAWVEEPLCLPPPVWGADGKGGGGETERGSPRGNKMGYVKNGKGSFRLFFFRFGLFGGLCCWVSYSLVP